MKKTSIVFMCMIALAAFSAWAPNVYAFTGFDDGGGGGLPACAVCHNPDHGAHANISNNDCDSCHINSGGPGRNNPPLENCVRCHGRDQDAGGDNISAGIGRGLRKHHEVVGAALCGNCHGDATGPVGVGEDILPSFYPQALNGAGLDSCDGSEEQFPSNSVSLDNDGDGFTDGADPDCAGNQPPVADPNGPYNGTVGIPVVFDGTGSSDPDGTIVAWDWDFGDGNFGTGETPTHTYAADGDFTVTLTVTDDAGTTDTATTTATIGVGNQPPIANPNGPYTGTVGVPVSFDGSGSSDPDGTIVAYDWDFGDGNVGTGETPTHTYAADGTFNVTLTVTDDAGTTDSAMTTATISPVGVVIEAEIEAPGSINAANRGRTPIEIEFDGDNMDNGMPVEIVELQCGGDVSNAMTMPERINAEDDDENEFVALFRTSDLMLTCEDTEIVCTGTLSDGTMFEGMSGIRVVRDFEGNRCKDGDDDDDDDHGRKRKHSRR